MADPAVDVVRHQLKHYLDTGVFMSLSEAEGRSGKKTFRFRWLLNREFALTVDPNKARLVADSLLPEVENRSFIDKDLRRFIAGRAMAELPRHRRVDPAAAALGYTNRKGAVSLHLQVLDGRVEYGLKALLRTINELFSYLQLSHIDYLHRNFGLPEE